MFLSDLLLNSYANDNTISYAGDNIDETILELQDSAKKAFHWFSDRVTNEYSFQKQFC